MSSTLLVLLLIATPNVETPRDPVILDFHAAWCGPCQQMRPAVQLLIEKGYPVKSVDLDNSPSLAKRYHVNHVPTFIVVDADGRELERTEGLQPASRLAALYKEAKSKLKPQVSNAAIAEESADTRGARAADAADTKEDTADEAPAKALPRPWETVVRIRVEGQGMIGFGSGTIIHSTPTESIILTCAHIFKIEGARTQPHPSRFPRPIMIDLFDGKLQGRQPAMVHCIGSVPGEAIDYDFTRDVGLIRIRPGKRLPAARVVPPDWQPRPKMEMITVGCSEGNDATAWTTWVVNPRTNLQGAGGPYEAIECVHAPKQGRSGGGLFTTDGHVAGVCDFAEPIGNHGLYASPRSIYRMLDQNRLMALYLPNGGRSETLVADNSKPQTAAPARTLRAQSPDRNETKRVTMPAPDILGIKAPAPASASTAADTSARDSWHSPDPDRLATNPTRSRRVSASRDPIDPATSEREQPVQTEIQMDPSVVDDPFPPPAGRMTDSSSELEASKPSTPSRWRAVRTPLPEPSAN